jgi:hypothetical protein
MPNYNFNCLGISCAMLLAGIIAGGPAAAQQSGTASTEITIKGTADPVCAMTAPVPNGEVNTSYAQNTITISNFINQTDATVLPSSITLRFPQVMCNTKAKVALTSANGGLVPTTPIADAVAGSGNFLKKVSYAVNGTWGQVSLPTLDTAQNTVPGASVETLAPGANSSELVLTVSTVQGTVPVIQGVYQDTLTVKVSAAY